jgi:serine/threonine protein phosphatase PrpC
MPHHTSLPADDAPGADLSPALVPPATPPGDGGEPAPVASATPLARETPDAETAASTEIPAASPERVVPAVPIDESDGGGRRADSRAPRMDGGAGFEAEQVDGGAGETDPAGAAPGDGASGDGETGQGRPAWNTVVAPAAPREVEVAPVVFSPAEGSYHPPLTLFLTCATGDAEIRYTDDGSEPTPDSALYARGDSLFYTASTVVSARAYGPGMTPGPVATHRYELQAPQWRVMEPEDGSDPVPHQRHDREADFAPGWSLAAASTRGRLHAHRGAWREDAYAWARRGEWTILAVSDGAGSAPLSRVGSQTACDRAVEELRLRLPEHPPREGDAETLKRECLPALRARLANAARAALNGLREEAATRGEPVEAFAATLLLAVLCPWGNGHLVAGLQVGDGQIALLTRGEDGRECRLLGEADHGAHSSETRFLTTRGVDETMEHRVRFALPECLQAVALMTDGISDDFFPEDRRLIELFTGEPIAGMADRDGEPLRGVLASVAGAADPGRALAEWIEYERKGSSDDRTLLLLWARG